MSIIRKTKTTIIRLTEKEEHFCREYVCDAGLNATRAYRTAFPSVSYTTARTEASKLLAKPNISARILELKQERYQYLEITTERVLTEIAKSAFCDIREFFYDDGRIKPLSEIDPDHASVLCSLEIQRKISSDGSGGKTIITRIKLPDKRASLELLGKHLKLFTVTRPGISVVPILQALRNGEITVRDAAYDISILGEPLPEILKIELTKDGRDSLDIGEGTSADELERRAQEALVATMAQREYFLPQRQEEVRQIKESLKHLSSFNPEIGR